MTRLDPLHKPPLYVAAYSPNPPPYLDACRDSHNGSDVNMVSQPLVRWDMISKNYLLVQQGRLKLPQQVHNTYGFKILLHCRSLDDKAKHPYIAAGSYTSELGGKAASLYCGRAYKLWS